MGAAAAFEAWADRIHLEGGGVLEADSWEAKEGKLRIDGPSGSVSIPLSLVVRIERTAAPGSPRPHPDLPKESEPSRATAPAPPRRRPFFDEARLAEKGSPGALLAEGKQAFLARDYERAASRFWQALSLEPDWTAARVGYAASEMALGRDPAALAAVLDGLARDPTSPDLYELLGDLRDREEQVDLAAEAWREAFRLAPNDRLRSKVERAARELEAGRKLAFSASAHFNLRYEGTLDPSLAAAILDGLEASYTDLSRAFRHGLEKPVTVLLYPSEQFRDVTRADEAVGGLYDGKIRLPLRGIARFDERLRRVLVHELAHAFVQSKTRGPCPRWLHEGIAQRFEGRRLTSADLARVRSLISGGEPAAWESRAFSYPAALSLTLFLEERRGWEGLLELLDRLGRGETFPMAFESVYAGPYERLCRDWAEHLGASREAQP